MNKTTALANLQIIRPIIDNFHIEIFDSFIDFWRIMKQKIFDWISDILFTILSHNDRLSILKGCLKL